MKFTDLALAQPVLRGVADQGYETATPIQAQTIPPILEGRDVLGAAQTGTGKTAAFSLPTLHRLLTQGKSETHGKGKGKRSGIRCLVLAPTRELASQIGESFKNYGRHTPLRGVVIYGGVNQRPQVKRLESGVDICVATPGRLIDLIGQGHVDLSHVQTLILDEADRMLDMGFIPDITRIVRKLPESRQTLLFSATMPKAIRKLSRDWLHDPVTVQIAVESATVEQVRQSVAHVTKANKTPLLLHYLEHGSMHKAILFTRTKHGADKLVKKVKKAGVAADAIHGNKSQNYRQRTLDGFRKGRLAVLVATDVAARGIDIDDVTHVVNYDVPRDAESYVHRIGRTARAGAQGTAITFCDSDERPYLSQIEKLIQMNLDVRDDAAGLVDATPGPAPQGGSGSGSAPGRGKRRGRSGGGGGNGKSRGGKGGEGRRKNKKGGARADGGGRKHPKGRRTGRGAGFKARS